MALLIYLDASALAKRYVSEAGTPVVNHLFHRVPRDRMACLTLTTVEVVSIFVRKKNGNRITFGAFQQALKDFDNEVLGAAIFRKLTTTDVIVSGAIPFLDKHALNATDAIFLHSALDFATRLRAIGDDLLLIAADRRLLRAAQAEGVLTFDPESQTEADLDALLGP